MRVVARSYALPGVLVVGVIGTAIALDLSPVLIIGAIVGAAVLAVLFKFPEACLPASFWAMTFTPLLRRIVGGADAYTPNDPLVFVSALVLLPVILRRGISLDRLFSVRSVYLVLAVIAAATFTLGLATGGAPGPLILGLATLVIPLLSVLALKPYELKTACLRLIGQGRLIGLVAAAYGYMQYVAPLRWDLRWLESRREVVSSFGSATAGEFRLFGPTSSPLSFALILSICICCWMFSRSGVSTWPRICAISFMAIPLLLTSVRTSVFALLVAAMIVGLLRRSGVAAILLALTAAVYAALPALLGTFAPALAGRYALTGIGSDISFVTRVRLLRDALGPAVFSVGLGPGGSTSESTVIDNGYLASFLDLGLIGGAVLLVLAVAAFCWALRASVQRAPLAPHGAFAIIVLVLILSQASAPVFQEEIGLFFWLGLLLLAQPHSWQLAATYSTSSRSRTSSDLTKEGEAVR